MFLSSLRTVFKFLSILCDNFSFVRSRIVEIRFFLSTLRCIKWNVITTLGSNFDCCIDLVKRISAKTTTLWQTERFDYDTSEKANKFKTKREMAYSKVVIVSSVYCTKAGVTIVCERPGS